MPVRLGLTLLSSEDNVLLFAGVLHLSPFTMLYFDFARVFYFKKSIYFSQSFAYILKHEKKIQKILKNNFKGLFLYPFSKIKNNI